MSTYREDIAELISVQIQTALENEYNRGWKACMEYYWNKNVIAIASDKQDEYDDSPEIPG